MQDLIEQQKAEIGRLRSLCKLLAAADSAGDPDGQVLRTLRVENAELQISLRNAWDELERKQQYLESAVSVSDNLREEAALAVSRANATDPQEVEALKVSLHEAWAELEVKQAYLSEAMAANERLSQELANLSQQDNSVYIEQNAALTASLHDAWAELERKQSDLETALTTNHEIKQELDRRQREDFVDPRSVQEIKSLEAALNDAWAELERKQSFLQTAVDAANIAGANNFLQKQEIASLEAELASLKKQSVTSNERA